MSKFKNLKAITITSITAMTLALGAAGCTPGNNVGGATVAGVAAGGLLGAAAFGGNSGLGILAGALIGGIVGNQAGQYMDEQDRINMQNAVITTPVGQQATWTNAKNVTYTVEPVKDYRQRGRYCREFQTKIKINGQWKQAYGHACRMPDGSWKIINK